MNNLGATGQFPRGKIHKSDEGAVNMAVGHDPKTRTVIVDFGTQVVWIGLDPATARILANSIIEHAEALDKK